MPVAPSQMKLLLLLGLVATAVAAGGGKRSLGQEGGPGTQTVLLIKGGVGFDVNLLSSKQPIHHHMHKSTAAVAEQAADLKTEQKVAEDLTSQLRTSVSDADKVYGEIKSLRDRDNELEQKLTEQQTQVDELKRKELEDAKSTAVKDKMLLKERRRGDLLEKKVKDLEQDLLVSGKAWREAAMHEKHVAEKEEEVTRESLEKVDRLEAQSIEVPRRRPVARAPHMKAKSAAATTQKRRTQVPRRKAPAPKRRQAIQATPRAAVHKAAKRRAVTLKRAKAAQPADVEPVSPMEVGYSAEDVAEDAADAEATQEDDPQAEETTAPADAVDDDVAPAEEAPVQEGDEELLDQQPLIQASAESVASDESADEAPADEAAASDSIVAEADQQDAEDAVTPAADEESVEQPDVLTPEATNSVDADAEVAVPEDADAQ